MVRLSLDKVKALGRSHRKSEHGEQTQIDAMETAPPDDPPPYTAVAADNNPSISTQLPSSATTARTVSASYRQTHRPPEYQPNAKGSSGEELVRAISTASCHSRVPCGDRSLAQELSRAALAGKVDTVRALLEAGAELYESSPSGTTSAVHDALRGPTPELALLVLDYPCERAYQGGASAERALDGEASVRALLSVTDDKGCTPLHLAASAGAADVVREMVGLGACVDVADDLGRTPLHMAARYARVDAVDVLLEHGADPERVDGKLWARASSVAQRELGDYMFVVQCIARRVRKRQGHDVKDDEDVKGAHLDGQEHMVAMTAACGSKTESIRTSTVFSLGYGALSASASTSSPAVSKLPRCFPHRDPAGTAQAEASSRRQCGRRPGRRAPDTLLFTPQYVEWSKMCKAVQNEHRRQKERNLRNGSGDAALGFGVYI